MSGTPTKIDIAWAAGLFEGEGCITMSGVIQSPRLKVSMVDRDVVRRFGKIVGRGHYCIYRTRNVKHKEQLCWYTGRKLDVAYVLSLLMPYFGHRRMKRAKEVYARCFRYGRRK